MTDSFDKIPQKQSKAEDHSSWLSAEAMSEFASSMSASVSGAVTFSIVAASKRTPLAIPAALLAGSVTKLGVKSGLESMFVDEKDRTAGVKDLAWGALDALAGVAGSHADRIATRSYGNYIARQALGANITPELAEVASKQLIADNAVTGVKNSLIRGLAGGSAASFTWSVPHRLVENADAIKNDPREGLFTASKQIFTDTAVGTAFGGLLSAGTTSLFRSPELLSRAQNALNKPADLVQLRTLHINDFHSQNDQLGGIKTVADNLTADANKRGIPSQFVTVGDLEGCNVQYVTTKAGMPENSAFMKMGVTKFIPGNHTYDLGSGFNVPGYARTMSNLLSENPKASMIATNLDLSAFPEYERIAQKFTIDTIQGPKGPEKIATLGLVTKEGTSLGDVPGIGYKDATNSAVQTMLDIANQHGVKKFVILSHLGLGEDKALAQALINDSNLAANNLKVSSIFSAHTHDVTAAPVWVGQNGVSAGGISSLRNLGNYEIPIVQAGSNGRWLGQLDLAIRPDGAASRFNTTGRMHAITPDVPKDAALEAFVHAQTAEQDALRNTVYNSKIFGDVPADSLRTGESQLGNIVSDAVDAQVKADAVITHSGWMRRGLEANVDPRTGNVLKPLTREAVADMFKSGGNAELEKGELQIYKMSGKELRDILEFGTANHTMPKPPTLGQMVRNAFSDKPLNPPHEQPGLFSQVAGMKYEFDMSKPAGSRIGNISIRSGNGTEYVPLDPGKEYSIASRQFVFDKWTRAGIFGGRTVEQTPVGKSPIEMVGEYLANREIKPGSFKPQGRITDRTPGITELPIKVGLPIVTPAFMDLENKKQ